MRVVREKLSSTSAPGNLIGLYLSELNHATAEVIEATIDDGREAIIGIKLADMLDIIYGAAAQLGIDRTELTNLRMQRHAEHGPYTDKVTP